MFEDIARAVDAGAFAIPHGEYAIMTAALEQIALLAAPDGSGGQVLVDARREADAVALKKAAGLQKGSGEPNTKKVGKVTRAQLEEIAQTKDADLTAADLDAAVRTIAGSARSMGLEVEGL